MKEVRKQQCFISISAYIIKIGTTNKLVQGKKYPQKENVLGWCTLLFRMKQIWRLLSYVLCEVDLVSLTSNCFKIVLCLGEIQNVTIFRTDHLAEFKKLTHICNKINCPKGQNH